MYFDHQGIPRQFCERSLLNYKLQIIQVLKNINKTDHKILSNCRSEIFSNDENITVTLLVIPNKVSNYSSRLDT